MTESGTQLNMTARICFGLLLLIASPVIRAAAAFPLRIHAGTIERMERLEVPLAFVKLSEAVAAGDMSAPDIVPAWLREERSAPDGQVYVVFTIAVLPDRSLSRFDYALAADGQQYPCLGLALESANVFDERRIEQRGAGIVKMAFACPASAGSASLVSRYPDLPLSDVKDIVLIEKAPEPEAAPVTDGTPAAAEDAAAAPAEGTPAPAAEDAAEDAAAAPAPAPEEAASAPAAPAPEEAATAPAPAPAPKPAPKPKPVDDIFTF